MELNNKSTLSIWCLILVLLLSGCELTGWMNTDSLDEYSDKVRITMATLVTYIGKTKEEVRKDFGDPTEIKHDSSLISTHYQQKKVPFDEIWFYIYRRGIPGINAVGSTKEFYFYEGKVVAVDAY